MTLNNTILNYITSLLAGGAEQSNSEEHPFNHKRKRNINQDIRTTLHVFDWVSYLIGSLRVFILPQLHSRGPKLLGRGGCDHRPSGEEAL